MKERYNDKAMSPIISTIILIVVTIVLAVGIYSGIHGLVGCHSPASYKTEGKVTDITGKVYLTDASGQWRTNNIVLVTLNNTTTYYFDISIDHPQPFSSPNRCFPVYNQNLLVTQLIGLEVQITYVNQTYGLPGYLAINLEVLS